MTGRPKKCRKVLQDKVMGKGPSKIRDTGLGQDLEVHPEDSPIARKEISVSTEMTIIRRNRSPKSPNLFWETAV